MITLQPEKDWGKLIEMLPEKDWKEAIFDGDMAHYDFNFDKGFSVDPW